MKNTFNRAFSWAPFIKARFVMALVAMVSIGYSAEAQTTISKADKDAMLAQRQQLVNQNISPRQIDAQLLVYNIKFPAQVQVVETASTKTLSFTTVRDFTESNAGIYANRLQNDSPNVEAVTIDHRTSICTVTFSKNATDSEISQIINRFGFDGFNVVK